MSKLTLSVSSEVIDHAKEFAKAEGCSVSALVESYLKSLYSVAEIEDCTGMSYGSPAIERLLKRELLTGEDGRIQTNLREDDVGLYFSDGTLLVRQGAEKSTYLATLIAKIQSAGFTISRQMLIRADVLEDWSSISKLRRIDTQKSSEKALNGKNLLTCILSDAIRLDATDILIRVGARVNDVSFRRDGVHIQTGFLTREKADVISQHLSQHRYKLLNFSPEDSGDILRYEIGDMVDGLFLVIRRLRMPSQIPTIDEIGYSAVQAAKLKDAIEKRSGNIFISGPKNSGKTTTLSSLAHFLVALKPAASIVAFSDADLNLELPPQVLMVGKNEYDGIQCYRPDFVIADFSDDQSFKHLDKASASGAKVIMTMHGGQNAMHALRRLMDLEISIGSKTNFLDRAIIVHQTLLPSKAGSEGRKKVLYSDMIQTGPLSIAKLEKLIRGDESPCARYTTSLDELVNNGLVDKEVAQRFI